MIELLKAFLFGIVEGITEWLPISSTGHMILLNEFVKLDVSEAFYSMFEVVIQLGAILAVVVLFWGQIFPFERRKGRHGGASIVLNMDTVKLWIKILVACVPAAIVGLKWNDLFEELFYNYQTVSIALIVFGAAFILVENAHKGKPARINALTELTYPTVFMIGMFQLIAAVFPAPRAPARPSSAHCCSACRVPWRRSLRSFWPFRSCSAQACSRFSSSALRLHPPS